MPVRKINLAVSLIAATLITPSLSTPAHAAERRVIAVAPGPLDRAIAVLAQQSGVDIGSAEPGLSRVMTRGARGRLTAAAALDQMLAGTPYTAQRLGGGSFRIVRRAVVRQPVARERQPKRPLTPPPVEVSPEIIVTATKRATSRLRFPGALTILRPSSGVNIRNDAANGMDEAIAATPILQSTALGAGRNKLFIRGVADSSFTGPTQSTANVYFGEVPVAYNGPEPGLNLYDVDQVEVLEGPQGTLYGAGAIGGSSGWCRTRWICWGCRPMCRAASARPSQAIRAAISPGWSTYRSRRASLAYARSATGSSKAAISTTSAATFATSTAWRRRADAWTSASFRQAGGRSTRAS
ncbi:TonB-dependent receptor [Sphingomonas sp. 22L2VL55-3]